MSHRRRCRRSPGFSLVDLLVVLVLLGIVCAVLSPLFVVNKGMAGQSRCHSNQKQFGIGLLMYAQDHDEAFPPAVLGGPRGSVAALDVVWADVAAPYLKRPPGELTCPNVDTRRGALAEYARLHPGQTTGYAYNAFYDDAVRAGGKKPPVLGSLGTTILLCEARPGMLALYGPDLADAAAPSALINPRFLEVTAASPEGATRHSKGANYTFADGHARWHGPEQLLPRPKSDGETPGFGL